MNWSYVGVFLMVVGALFGFKGVADGNRNKWIVENGSRGSAMVVERQVEKRRSGSRYGTGGDRNRYYLASRIALENGETTDARMQVGGDFFSRTEEKGVYPVAYDPSDPTFFLFVDDKATHGKPGERAALSLIAFLGGAVALVVGKMKAALNRPSASGKGPKTELGVVP